MDSALIDLDLPLMTKVLPVSVCNVKYISCPVQCQLDCQWAVPKFCAQCISLQSLEAGGVLGKCSDWQPCGEAQCTSSCTTNCHQEWSNRSKGTHRERQQKQQTHPTMGLQCVRKSWAWVTVKSTGVAQMPFESQSKQRITGEAGDRLNSNYTGGERYSDSRTRRD